MKNNEVTINDNVYNVNTAIGDAKNHMYLFYRNLVGGKAKMTLYSCKIYDDGVLVRDFIPCSRKSDGLIGLYDTVTKEFYTNAGTGEFIGG